MKTFEDTFPIISKRDKVQLPENLYGLGERIGGANIFKRGKVTAQELVDAGNVVVVKPGQDIQAAIDKVNLYGGGKVILGSGTHFPLKSLVVPSHIIFEGEGSDNSIIDFNSTQSHFSITKTPETAAGTISVNNNSTAVAGVGTTFTDATAGDYILIRGIWYEIASITDDTNLVLSVPFADVDISATGYTIAAPKQDIAFIRMTVQNSAATTGSFNISIGNEFLFEDVTIISGVRAMQLSTVSNITIRECEFIAQTTDGLKFTDCHYVEVNASGIIDTLANHGLLLSNITNSVFSKMFILNPAGDGVNLTSGNDVAFVNSSFVSAGGQGIELVATNNRILVSGNKVHSNASDGIKMTASSDDCIVSNNSIKDNGAYGSNIAAATCDNNLIIGNNFSGNVTAASNDSGTGTLIRSNIGLADN